MKKQAIFLVVCFFGKWTHLSGQDHSADSSFFSKAVTSARSQYMKSMGTGSYFYNSVAYERYWNGMLGHPFFISEAFRQGNLYYNGVLYEDVPLMYDLSRDQLVTKNFSKELNVKLLTEKIDSFSIGKNNFVRVVADSNVLSIPAGFYEKLYSGNIVVLGKYEKKVEYSLRAEDKITKLVEHDHYFIGKEGKYHLITGESDLLSVFKEQRGELRKFLNRREVNFKKDPAATIVQAVAYYEQLKK
jgi:hypothetical protein